MARMIASWKCAFVGIVVAGLALAGKSDVLD